MADKKSKKKKTLWLLADALVVLSVIATAVFVVVVMRNDAKSDELACKAPGKQHELTLQNDRFSQESLTVALCDTIAVTNLDDQPYGLNFGNHDKHYPYRGYESVTQLQNERVVIDALEAGTFRLHDHYRDEAALQLTVTNKQ